MNRSQFNHLLRHHDFLVENPDGIPFKIGDQVQVLEDPKMEVGNFPESLLGGLVGTVVGFDKSVHLYDSTGGDFFPPLILVLLPINNLQVYSAEELKVLPSARRLFYVGLEEPFWGLIIQALRKWAYRVERLHGEHAGALSNLGDRLVKLGREIEQQIKERKVHDG